MQYLLDTSICVFYLRGKLELARIIKEKGRENFFISEISVAELPPHHDDFDLLIGVTAVEYQPVLITDTLNISIS